MSLLRFEIKTPSTVTFPIGPELGDITSPRFIDDVYSIFSNPKVIKDYPEKKHASQEDTKSFLSTCTLNTMLDKGQTCFIRFSSNDYRLNNKIIGVIEIILYNSFSAERKRFYEKEWPKLIGCCEIQYWLNPDFWGEKIMSTVINHVSNILLKQNISAVSAFVYTTNTGSLKVLKHAAFKQTGLLNQDSSRIFSHQIKTTIS